MRPSKHEVAQLCKNVVMDVIRFVVTIFFIIKKKNPIKQLKKYYRENLEGIFILDNMELEHLTPRNHRV